MADTNKERIQSDSQKKHSFNKEYQEEDRLNQLKNLESLGINAFPAEAPRTHKNGDIIPQFTELNGKEVSICGRITAIRDLGKLVFYDVKDETGRVQASLDEKTNPQDLKLFKENFATGDFVAVTGKVYKTTPRGKEGEPTVNTEKLTILTKALLPPPNAVPSDLGYRDRHRWVDMLTSEKAVKILKTRADLVKTMRRTFEDLGCIEVETPILVEVYGGANAKPFTTRYNALDINVFGSISPELELKKAMVGGLIGGAFYVAKCLRNENSDYSHNPEFTQIEAYVAYMDYLKLMPVMERLISEVARRNTGSMRVNYQGYEIDLTPPWNRLRIADGLKEKFGIVPEQMSDAQIIAFGKKHGIDEIEPGRIILELFDKEIGDLYKPANHKPAFIMDYPRTTSPLTKVHRLNPYYVERFECLVPTSKKALETANCYSELTNPLIQKANFDEQMQRRGSGDKEAMPTDDLFVEAMKYGMPPMGGIGISVDRWTMLLTDSPHIRNVIFYPITRAN